MSASRAATTELSHDTNVQWVSSQMGISPTAARCYLTDDALADLARTMVVSVADETPGADVIESARTAAVPLPILGRCIAGLSEAIQIRLRELDDIEHMRTTVAQLDQPRIVQPQLLNQRKQLRIRRNIRPRHLKFIPASAAVSRTDTNKLRNEDLTSYGFSTWNGRPAEPPNQYAALTNQQPPR
jgi:hypothetical protein